MGKSKKVRKSVDFIDFAFGLKMPKTLSIVTLLGKNGFKYYVSRDYVIVEIEDVMDLKRVRKILKKIM